MNRVLVIAYYFPPMGLSGVQRVAKFVKYLPEYGWSPTVLTVAPGGYFAYDDALLHELEAREIEIHRTESRDPTRLFSRKEKVGLPREAVRKTLAALSQFVFIPDNKIGWKKAAVETGSRLLQKQRFDVVFSSAPPYTGHLVGLDLSRTFNLPLVTDFRDDWVGNPRHWYPTPWHRKRHQALERQVMLHSRHVTTINRVIQGRLLDRNQGASGYERVSVLPQGYDPDDFEQAVAPRTDRRLRLLYTGVFYDAQQPDPLLNALATFLERHPERRSRLEARFVGLFPESGRDLVRRLGLEDVVELRGYVPHPEAVAELLTADVLWMIVGRQPGEASISTGKLHEYIGSRKPILGLVPDGAARRTLEAYGATFLARPDRPDEIIAALETLFERWRMNQLPQPDAQVVARYDRKVLTGKLAKIFVSTLHTE